MWPFIARVDVVDHRGERGRLARAGLAGDEDQAVVRRGTAAHGFGILSSSSVSAFEGMARNTAPMPFELAHHVDAEAARRRESM